ncbi:unnamed protein product [Clonostachys solani]|uniref:Gfo/Idh/MocA-like oxidoreductase N-terminal domain-containing protein n=1 Tax=Clonostachys solani TaxID=160281 RepID=A0A9N9Z8U5_9HYPO|nr:unnamed protein product [Clonostachys solani]
MPSPLGLAVIGTNWISNSFVQSSHESKRFQLKAVYSRSIDSATKFISQTPSVKDVSSIKAFDSLDKMLTASEVDVVYIASPNSFHYEHGIKSLTAGKHIIVEKPFVSNADEVRGLFKLADTKGLCVIEAWRHIQEPNFLKLQRLLDDEKSREEKFGQIYGANISLAVYNPEYAKTPEDGKEANVVLPKFSGGCLWDVGCYSVAFIFALFGTPASQTYFPIIIRTGVDGGGNIIFQYTAERSKHKQEFVVHAQSSKLYVSHAPTEIYCEKGTIRINGVSSITEINTIEFIPHGQTTGEEFANTKPEYSDLLNLTWEATEFGRIIQEGDKKAEARLRDLSLDILIAMEDMRKNNGIFFDSDKYGK